MRVAGIDFSSFAIDVVLIDADGLEPPVWHRYTLGDGADAFDRTRMVADAMPGRHSGFWDDVYAVGIEHPAGKFGTGPMMRVQGAVLACLPSEVLVQPWPPAAWRKAVGLPGNASKRDVSVFVVGEVTGTLASCEHPAIAEYNADESLRRIWPQDACDAYCIALATRGDLDWEAA